MLSVPTDPETESRLAAISAKTGEAPGVLVGHALRAHLEELEDYALAVEAWKAHDPAKTLSTEEMLRELGVAD